VASSSKKTGDELVGRRIAERRTDLQMSRDDLAREIGASYALVSQIETGYRMPSYANQLLIAKALNTSLDEIFGDEDATADLPAPMPAPSVESVARFADAAAVFPLGEIANRRASSSMAGARVGMPRAASAPNTNLPSRLTFEEVVEQAASALRNLPASRRLDALARVQLSVTREVVEEERRRVGTGSEHPGWITELRPNEVFVFGSNPDGIHAGGSARAAFEKFGAEWGKGRGHHGQSYAIVTTDGPATLHAEVAEFLRYAAQHADLRFLLTPIGTGVAGYRADEIAPLFKDAPANVVLPAEFLGE
jgi:transcriptional regulator with XRE-family HTH domain